MPDQNIIEHAQSALDAGRPAEADRLLSALEREAFAARDQAALRSIWPVLARTRIARRQRAAGGRIDLHTHTTASDGEMTVEQSLCEHFVRGQILIDDHNIIDSLTDARRLISERDLELDVFLGIEVICTRERRAFEFHAIAPTLSGEFLALAAENLEHWHRACELFVDDFVRRDDFFEDPLWKAIAKDHEVRESFDPVIERYEEIRRRIVADGAVRQQYLERNKTFDLGRTWSEWQLGRDGDPPQLAHRVFGSMRCYAMNAYPTQLGDWFEYDKLARRFKDVGCFVSHNHPNYWDEDFIGELPHTLQEEWIRDFADRGVIDALEVWSPPFASVRVPHYWEKVCNDIRLVPMAGTDCHSGREQEFGGSVDDHPEIPPQIYAKLTASAIERARSETNTWEQLTAWRRVLEIDYAQAEALMVIQRLVE